MTTTEIMNLADTYADGPHTEGYYGVHRAALLSAIEALVRDAEGTGFVDVYRDAKRYRWLRDSMDSPIVSEAPAPPKMVTDPQAIRECFEEDDR